MRRIWMIAVLATVLLLPGVLWGPTAFGASRSHRDGGHTLRDALRHLPLPINHRSHRDRRDVSPASRDLPPDTSTQSDEATERELDRLPRLLSRARLEPTPSPDATSRPTGAPAGAYLKINGRNFTFSGSRVMLHGINFSNEPADSCANGEGPQISKINSSNADYAKLSSLGGNLVRFNMDFGWYAGNRSQFFAVLDQHVRYAKANHLWLLPSLGTAPGGGCDFQQTGLWGNQGNQDLLNSFWQDFASHYRNEPTIAGYDMLNEPGPPSDGEWQNLGQRLRNTITAADANHFVVYGATVNDTPPITGNNIVYEDHLYPGGTNYPSSVPSSVPFFVGEFGAKASDANPTAFVREQIARYRADGQHWAYFVMREGAGGYGLFGCSGAGDFSCAWPEMIAVVKEGMAGSVRP